MVEKNEIGKKEVIKIDDENLWISKNEKGSKRFLLNTSILLDNFIFEGRQSASQSDKQTDSRTQRWTDRQTNIQSVRQTDRGKEGQKDRNCIEGPTSPVSL